MRWLGELSGLVNSIWRARLVGESKVLKIGVSEGGSLLRKQFIIGSQVCQIQGTYSINQGMQVARMWVRRGHI